MADDREPRFRRRKTARPAEIIAAALEVFAERGFAAARLEDIARRAGVSKAALYLYFPDKDALFRAVVGEAIAPNFADLRAMARAYRGPFAALAPLLLERIAEAATTTRLPAVAKMIIGESRNFPQLAR
ncbi:MAG: helix-turn-helix domain-containing protein, partial [Pseudomonadota bacterium]